MQRIKRLLLGGLAASLLWSCVYAANPFVVRNVRIKGTTGLSKATILSYVPISIGDTFTEAKSSQIISSLYGSGFFSNVKLERQDHTLVINVTARPTIGSVSVKGNAAIKKEDLQKHLKGNGLVVGNVYARTELQSLKQELLNSYYATGHYNARISTSIKSLPRNRVGITLTIYEGGVTQVRDIRFIGNHAFSDKQLKKQLIITTPKLWSFITKGDQYSKPKLDESLSKLKTYYLNHGYIRLKIDSSQVSLSPDREHVYIVIHISEGAKYHIKNYSISGQTILPKDKLRQLIDKSIKPGDVFTKKAIGEANEAVAFALGDKGYAFASIVPVPHVNDNDKTVSIDFHVSPGTKVYVRRILFRGNSVTADYVLRRTMIQMEGGLLSSRKVKQSVRELNLLGFFQNVTVKTVPVPGTTNQVDLVYHVQETSTSQAKFNIGYGTLGFEIGAGIDQPNFLGTGRTVGVSYQHNDYATTYSLNYYNPYYTINNVGVGYSAYYRKTHPDDNIGLSSAYTTDTFGINANYNVRLTLNSHMGFGAGYEHLKLNTLTCKPADITSGKCRPVSDQIQAFVENNGDQFNIVTLNAKYNYSTLDRSIFPTTGFATSVGGELSLPIFKDNLSYYKVGGNGTYYLPLNQNKSFILRLHGGADYGNGYGNTDMLPIFFNYYAGGLSQGLNRGYETNTLGPKDSNSDAIGGNLLVYYGASVILPNTINPDQLRLMLYLDGSNVYQTEKNVYGRDGLFSKGAGPIRYSAGIAAKWRSFLGPIIISFGKALNKQHGDDVKNFQFTMGTEF